MFNFLFSKAKNTWFAQQRGLGQCSLLAAIASLLFSASSPAAVILSIDITDPGAVRISATGAFAQNDDIDSTDMLQGFLLLGFFDQAPGWDVPDYLDESELYSPGGMFEYTDLYYDGVDLNITGGGFSTQDFSTTQPAFEGYALVDFSDVAHLLVPGKTGDVLAGDMWESTVVIGQYQIIPEPTTSLLLLGSLGTLLLGRRKR